MTTIYIQQSLERYHDVCLEAKGHEQEDEIYGFQKCQGTCRFARRDKTWVLSMVRTIKEKRSGCESESESE